MGNRWNFTLMVVLYFDNFHWMVMVQVVLPNNDVEILNH